MRALALPRGETVMYRYEEGIVSPAFRDAVNASLSFGATPVDGDTAYLCYLDNRDKAKEPKVFPLREAVIRGVTVLGTTYLVKMDLECFLDWNEEPALDQLIKANSIDALPHWGTQDQSDPTKKHTAGNWLAGTTPLPDKVFQPYSDILRSHLKAFEAGARAISTGADFATDKYLFATVTGILDAQDKTPLGGGALRAGRRYDLYLYHFQPGDGTHEPLENFRLEATSDNEDVLVIGSAERRVEARYDEIVYSFRVKDEAKDGIVSLGLNIKRLDSGAAEPIYTLRGALERRVASSRLRKMGFGALIGLGLFGTQAVTLFSTDKLTAVTFFSALAFSLLAGMGASFQVKTKV